MKNNWKAQVMPAVLNSMLFEATDGMQKRTGECGLCQINDHIEFGINAAAATQIVFRRC